MRNLVDIHTALALWDLANPGWRMTGWPLFATRSNPAIRPSLTVRMEGTCWLCHGTCARRGQLPEVRFLWLLPHPQVAESRVDPDASRGRQCDGKNGGVCP